MALRAGILTEYITIQKKKREKDDFGALKTIWQDQYNIHAHVAASSGSREISNNEVVFTNAITFLVRYKFNPNGDDNRILWNKRAYRILSVIRDRIRQSTTITAEVVNE